MQIRPEQLLTLATASETCFVSRVAEFLRGQSPEARDADPAQLDGLIRLLIRRAAAYDLTINRDVAVFIYVAFLLGVNFDTDFPAVQDVLPSPVLSSGDKVAWLTAWTSELLAALGAGGP